jgi:AraC-like DNA-binding protein
MPDPLLDAVARYTATHPGPNPYLTAMDGVVVLRSPRPNAPTYRLLRPALCVVLQGAKHATFGERRLEYRAGQALLVGLDMPALGSVIEATPEEPMLGLILELDLAVMSDVLGALDTPPQSNGDGTDTTRGAFVIDLEGPLADCALRMVRLAETPRAIPILYLAIMRELCYWLLAGPHGAEVARIVLANHHAHGVVAAVHALRDRFTEPLRIEELAKKAHLSTSAFHRQFKALTSMTPLQYQKQLRLMQARRLMLADAANVETAAFEVGYESASQFSREYARMFGAPPRRHVATLLGQPASP